VAGSVRKAQDRIRINVQLIDTASGRNVWANQYDRDFSDVLALQDEITETIIGEVNPDLLQFESELAMHEDSANLDAWTTAMQGWWHFNQRTPENMAKAVELFERAVEQDPQFGDAYAGLALAHYRARGFGWTDSPERTDEELLAAAETAVALDEFGAEAHHALGHAFAVTGQADRMIGAFALGVELNPSNAQANTCYGAHLAWVGRGEEAIEAITRAMSISPRDPRAFSYRTSMAWAYFAIQDYEHALEWAEEGIERRPNRRAYQVAVASLGQLGQLDRAEASLRELLRLEPDLSVAGLEWFFGPANRDFVDRLLDGLRKAGWEG
jgi:tetratricopeptide (TPR) repeat protein